MKIYVSGPMSGIVDLNRKSFEDAAAMLRSAGHVVVSPTELPPPSANTWEAWMRVDLEAMSACTHIYMLEGWTNSIGATIERTMALAMGMQEL